MHPRFSSFGLTLQYRSPEVMDSPHRHSEIELNLIESGSIVYQFGGVRHPFSAGQLVLFWGALPHQLIEIPIHARYFCLTLPLAGCLQWELPHAFMQQIMEGRPIADHGPGVAFDQALFQRWLADFEDLTPDSESIILLELEARLRRFALTSRTGRMSSVATRSKAETLAQYITEHSTEPLSVEQIARAANLHPNYAMTLFRKTYSVSLIDYLTQHRVAHAQRLLVLTDRKVADIALEVGFGSHSRFYEAFHAICGRSPGEYRRALNLPIDPVT